MTFEKFSQRIFFSFPVQLVIMQFKYNQLQLLYWVIMIGFVTGTFMDKYGLQYLFLDPEYLGKVNFLSFFITGFACGGFVMAFNISSYLLNSHRFPFLATLSRTFFKYTLNNFVVPFSFLLIYIFNIISFQYVEQFTPALMVVVYVLSFMAGYFIFIILVFNYFGLVNKDMIRMHGIKHSDEDPYILPMHYTTFRQKKGELKLKFPWIWHVETYLSSFTKPKLVRDTSHYSKEKIESVLKQNHFNAAMFQLAAFIAFIAVGFLGDFKVIRIPAAASVFLLFTIIIMISGVFRYWLKSWAPSIMILLLIALNLFSKTKIYNTVNAVFGLNYETEKVKYNHQTLSEYSTPKLYYEDKKSTIEILENWKKKWAAKGIEKPKMVLLNISGGGIRSMIFTFRNMQVIDSLLEGNLMNYTSLITGSSGGAIAASYYRQLFLEKRDLLMLANNHFDNVYVKNIGKDLLNGPAFYISTNDLFYNFRTFKDGKYSYPRDRAYAWEEELNDNTGNILRKRLRDYYRPEHEAKIPMMFITPGIINDGRGVYISPQSISYMTHAFADTLFDAYTTPNGVEFLRVFERQDAANLRFTSALRANSTFPYITPSAQLPSIPMVEMLDAGMRDNFGLKNSLRFLYVFKDWIKDNTSGVVLLQIRDTYKSGSVQADSSKSLVQKLFGPFGNITMNLIHQQDYTNDTELEYVNSCFSGKLDYVVFQLPDLKEKVPLSWHLTEREKDAVKRNVYTEENWIQLNKLKTLLQQTDVLK